MSRLSVSRVAVCLAFVAIVGVAATASRLAAASTGEVNEIGGVAIQGYDPVAYFRVGRPIVGSPDFTIEHKGATFRFASAENREAFRTDPGHYAPQYGGFCAYGTAHGYKAAVDPGAFTLVEGKLYLNYSRSVQRTWASDRAGYIARADTNWPAVALATDVSR